MIETILVLAVIFTIYWFKAPAKTATVRKGRHSA